MKNHLPSLSIFNSTFSQSGGFHKCTGGNFLSLKFEITFKIDAGFGLFNEVSDVNRFVEILFE